MARQLWACTTLRRGLLPSHGFSRPTSLFGSNPQVRELQGQVAAAASAREALEADAAARAAVAAATAAQLAAARQALADKGRGFALLRADVAALRGEVEEAAVREGRARAR
jgi:hypothetical protein